MNNPSSPWHWPKSLLVVGIAVAFCLYSLGAFVQSKSRTPATIGPFAASTSAPVTLKVQVLGAVKTPGVYDLPGGARVQDAITAAGGALPEADTSQINLADWAKDGSKISLPSIQSSPPTIPSTVPLVAATPSSNTLPGPPTMAATPAPGSTLPMATLPSGGASVNASVEYLKQNPLDLNQATAAQLEALPGVGEKMAARIIEYRTISGSFRSVADLDNVAGIGEKKLTVLRQLVVVR